MKYLSYRQARPLNRDSMQMQIYYMDSFHQVRQHTSRFELFQAFHRL